MNNNINGNPVGNVRGWYDSQLTKAKAAENQAAKEAYSAEIKKFQDSFDSVSRLDGTASDRNPLPGEVSTDSLYGSLAGQRSLRKTDEGFALTVSSGVGLAFGAIAAAHMAFGPGAAWGMPQTKTHESTEYQINEKTGTIAVTRDTTMANTYSHTLQKETFTLDPNTGEIRDNLKSSEYKVHSNAFGGWNSSGLLAGDDKK